MFSLSFTEEMITGWDRFQIVCGENICQNIWNFYILFVYIEQGRVILGLGVGQLEDHPVTQPGVGGLEQLRGLLQLHLLQVGPSKVELRKQVVILMFG